MIDPLANAADLLSAFDGACVKLMVRKINPAVNNARHKGEANLEV